MSASDEFVLRTREILQSDAIGRTWFALLEQCVLERFAAQVTAEHGIRRWFERIMEEESPSPSLIDRICRLADELYPEHWISTYLSVYRQLAETDVNPSTVEELLARVTRLDRFPREMYEVVALVLEKIDRPAVALAFFAAAGVLWPEEPDFHYDMGRTLWKTGRPRLAIPYLEEGWKQVDNRYSPNCAELLIKCYEALGETEKKLLVEEALRDAHIE